ncbi:acyl-CoA dehydrogenase family protein [Micromonospora sp. WMMD1102]|uniref:acyl-CoA dehydrogenase family protein n=1 Tax=Micromonospora sp. WMMD1102 TaxID=3016105 RepID=UPI0024157D40|nr:acyl-CoA dehydrogenase family protein [Micromonospora sp. WMMD1102]MDG4787865.1 acyl-CoA dehydrogenase family protein [Micromonospora sp. WMMD1102]
MTAALTHRLGVAGYPRALDDLHRGVHPDVLVPAPTGHVAASVAALPSALPTALHRFGLAVAPPAGDADGPAGAVPAEVADRFATGLLDLHRAVLRRAFDQAVRHLGERSSEGASLLARQLVQAQLADIAMALREDEVMPPERRCGDAAARWRTHQRLVRLGRTVLHLFGAAGFLLDGPAGELYLAEVTGNLYLHPGAPGPDTEDRDA